MAEWLLERGVGEDRAILVEGSRHPGAGDGRIIAARVDWPGPLSRGLVADAKLLTAPRGAPRNVGRDGGRAVALFPTGEEALVEGLPRQVSPGGMVRLEVTRPALAEGARIKRAQARPTTAPPRPAPSLAQALREEGEEVRIVQRFPAGLWDELLAEAYAREITFAGGALLLHPTPAMVLIDIDGTLDPRALALAAVEPLAAALRRFDVGGAVGVDFPTLVTRRDRQAVDAALSDALRDWPHERTAMNGFGFVQLVARLSRPSLLHRAAHQPLATTARWLLRQAEVLDGPGDLLLTAAPAVEPLLKAEWLAELARRTGRAVRFEGRDGLAPEAVHAQLVAR